MENHSNPDHQLSRGDGEWCQHNGGSVDVPRDGETLAPPPSVPRLFAICLVPYDGEEPDAPFDPYSAIFWGLEDEYGAHVCRPGDDGGLTAAGDFRSAQTACGLFSRAHGPLRTVWF